MVHSTQQVDTRVAPLGLLREMHDFYVRADSELLPDDPPEPFEQRLAGWRHISDRDLAPHWILREDDEIVGGAVLYLHKHEDLNNGFARLNIRPDRGRRGLGRTLARPVFEFMEAHERRSLIVDVKAGSPWEPKLAQLGMRKAFADKRSRLWVADLDHGLMNRWIGRAGERAQGYELLYLASPVPDEHIERWCQVQYVMHTAPKEDLEFEFQEWTPDKWRELEKNHSKAGTRMVGHVALDRATSDFVGLSNIYIQGYQTDLAWQGDTGVHPDHRNMGLGRWMKGATVLRVLEEHPEIERVDTFNAGSNEAMLNINLEMGYRTILVTHAWQGDLETVRKRLGV